MREKGEARETRKKKKISKGQHNLMLPTTYQSHLVKSMIYHAHVFMWLVWVQDATIFNHSSWISRG